MYRVVLLVFLGGLILGTVSGCKDGPTDPEEEMIEKTVTPTDGESEITDAELFDDETDEKLGEGETTVEAEEDSRREIRAESDGFISNTKTITFNDGNSEEIELSSDEVTVDYRAVDEDDELLEEVEIFVADTSAEEEAEGELILPYDDQPVEICSEAEYHEKACEEITPDENQQLELENMRKTVTYKITPEIEGYEDYHENPDTSAGTPTLPGHISPNTAYILQVGDSIYVDAGEDVDTDGIENTESDLPSNTKHGEGAIGEGREVEVPYPAGPENVEVHLRAIYFPKEKHEYSENDYLNVAENSFTFSGEEDEKRELNLKHVPACSDGINNDFTDGVDEEDPGCVDEEGNYDPEDDVELLKVSTSIGLFFHRDDEGNYTKGYISNSKGERTIQTGGGDIDKSILKAIEVRVWLDARVEEDEDGETFAVEFRCGEDRDSRPDSGPLSPIIEDDESDGWQEFEVPDVEKEVFEDGLSCGFHAIHASKIRGEEPGDGGEDIIFSTPDRDGAVTRQWIFEPEEFFEPYYWKEDDSSRAITTTGNTTSDKVETKDKQ